MNYNEKKVNKRYQKKGEKNEKNKMKKIKDIRKTKRKKNKRKKSIKKKYYLQNEYDKSLLMQIILDNILQLLTILSLTISDNIYVILSNNIKHHV